MRSARPRHAAVAAVLVLLAAGWAVAIWALWRTKIPGDLKLPRLDEADYFSRRELEHAEDYERFLRIDWLLATLASLAALTVLAVRGPRIVSGIAIGRIGRALVAGMVVGVTLFFVDLPFSVAARWWETRHDLARGSWFEWIVAPWLELVAGAGFAALTIAIVVALAARWPRTWWIAAAPVFTGIVLLFTFTFGYLAAAGTKSLARPKLERAAETLKRREGVHGTPIRVEKVSKYTKQANAYTVGVGPSRRVVLWDTLLDGRFSTGEIEVVIAHELGHVARKHLWKGVAWFGLFALPGTFLIWLVTRRRGGVGDPGLLPLGFLVLAVLQLAATPLDNVISRRYEAEADWMALTATRDPKSAQGLFQEFSRTSLQQPNEPFWDYVMLENHPTIMQRIAMARAYAERHKNE